jgi:hypothetical protein
MPAAHLAPEAVRDRLHRWSSQTASSLVSFLEGLALWDSLDHTGKSQAATVLREDLPMIAVERYEELYQRLAVQVPEFGFWSWSREHAATRYEVRTVSSSLARLESLLSALPETSRLDDRRRSLQRANHAAIRRPALADEGLSGATIPALEAIYLDPVFKVRQVRAGDHLADEGWWAEVHPERDLAKLIASALTGPDGTALPVLVLGQPGAGKSALTTVLAARLPATDFMPLRVELREVPADADLQDQIEHAIRVTTGEALSWPDLARSADGALPVVLLDGFDELLQATGVSQSDYLERVARFQEREADQGRPVAVLVTSRTAVAGRARVRVGTLVIRLEPFSAEQVEHWLSIWNSANAAALFARGLAPLQAEHLIAHGDLAAQPLLLLMLALYDTDDNMLQRQSGTFGTAQLYDQLLTAFAAREVRKQHPGSPDAAIQELVEHELLRLSVTAFAAFNRGQQWVSAADLDADLTALLGHPVTGQTTLRAPLGPGERLLGRFFFVQRAQARRDGRRLETYEFLHSTFGEYLVARLIVKVGTDLARQEAASVGAVLGGGTGQDGLLYTLLSFASLTSREAVLSFVSDLAEADHGLRSLPGALLRRIDARTDIRFAEYMPDDLPAPSRYARYSLNLVILAAAFRRDRPVFASELFGRRDGLIPLWRRHALLWASALSVEEWRSLLFSVQVARVRDNEMRDLAISVSRGDRVPGSPEWQFIRRPADQQGLLHWHPVPSEELFRQSNLLCDRNDDLALHALDALHERIGHAVTSLVYPTAGDAVSVAGLLLQLWSADVAADAHVIPTRHTLLAEALAADWPNWPEQQRWNLAALALDVLIRHATVLDRSQLATCLLQMISMVPNLNQAQARNVIDAALRNLALAPFDQVEPLIEIVMSAVRANPSLALYAWVGLAEAGATSTVLAHRQGFGSAEMVLHSVDWADLSRTDPQLIMRARWLFRAHHPEVDVDQLDEQVRQAGSED